MLDDDQTSCMTRHCKLRRRWRPGETDAFDKHEMNTQSGETEEHIVATEWFIVMALL